MSTPGNQSQRSYTPQRGIIPALRGAVHDTQHALHTLSRDVTVNRVERNANGRIVQRRIAVLTDTGPAGEADLTDNHYWCKFQKVTWSGTNAAFTDATAPGIGGIVKAQNLGEVSGHGIDLVASSVYVEVVKTLGGTSPAQAHWSFNYAVPAQDIVTGTLYLTANESGGGKYRATVLGAASTVVLSSTDLTRDDFGSTNSADAPLTVMAMNMLEIDGGANHRIDVTSTNKAELTFPGFSTGGAVSSGTNVLGVWKFWGYPVKVCT